MGRRSTISEASISLELNSQKKCKSLLEGRKSRRQFLPPETWREKHAPSRRYKI
jgi:hypothetical protein